MIPREIVLSQDFAVLVLFVFAACGWVLGSAVGSLIVALFASLGRKIRGRAT